MDDVSVHPRCALDRKFNSDFTNRYTAPVYMGIHGYES